MFRSAISRTLLSARPAVARANLRPVLARGYHEKVISHYERPRNVRIKSRARSGLIYLIKLYRLALFPKVTLTSAQAS